MTTLTEQAAEQLIAGHAFAPAPPGFVGAAVDVPASLSGRRPLRHGFLAARGPRLAVVSGPPSPGLAVCLDRMTDDLRAARSFVGLPGRPDAEAGIRVGLEAGLEGGGVLGLRRRWRLAHTVAPVLAASFAHAPAPGWRSVRQASRRDHPVVPPGDPLRAWLAYAMSTATGDGGSPRDRFRNGEPVTSEKLLHHLDSLRPPVAPRGHLELDVADAQPGDGWRVPIAIIATLLDDPQAAAEAAAATDHLAAEPRLWERAARDALTDPVLAAAARDCFLAAYAALSRQGAARSLRDAVADYAERYVLRSRTPADDVLDHALS
ncbi:glutamate-cysteine ligase family protein [Paractinoplanes globisporus]|uniref:Glutamate-cysteine ligase family protein n=1 Tax=Paractinoplanes globisporus TaxID=113565 RepID=A0ABW6WYG2_9ACTN|nr:glutamate-cysteine ligase family protein [Actinoplanes globisporus]